MKEFSPRKIPTEQAEEFGKARSTKRPNRMAHTPLPKVKH
jgi:hypothetical protein